MLPARRPSRPPGDNIKTARFIAAECGIYTPGQWPGDPAGGLAMEGPTFRALSDQELQEALPRLQVGCVCWLSQLPGCQQLLCCK